MTKLLTITECAFWLSRPRRTVRQWAERDQITPVACRVRDHAMLYDVLEVGDQCKAADTRSAMLRLTKAR